MYGTGEALAFFFVFLSQVLLISWYFPRRAVSRIQYVLTNYPPSTYPKLYPKPVEHYERVARNFARFNFALVVAGVSIVAALAIGTFGSDWDGAIVTPFSTSGEWDAAVVTPFLIVQFLPYLYYEIWAGRHARAMAKTAPPQVRTTELRRRRLVDFVSPALLVAAALTYVAFVVFILWYNRFGFAWFTAAGNITIFTAMYLVMGVSVCLAVYRRWPDHHQAHQDRQEIIRLVATRAVAIMIATPLLTMAQLTIKLFDPASGCTDRVCSEFLEPVIASIGVQIVAALVLSVYSYRVEKVDFGVYKRGAQGSDTDASTAMGSVPAGRS